MEKRFVVFLLSSVMINNNFLWLIPAWTIGTIPFLAWKQNLLFELLIVGVLLIRKRGFGIDNIHVVQELLVHLFFIHGLQRSVCLTDVFVSEFRVVDGLDKYSCCHSSNRAGLWFRTLLREWPRRTSSFWSFLFLLWLTKILHNSIREFHYLFESS